MFLRAIYNALVASDRSIREIRYFQANIVMCNVYDADKCSNLVFYAYLICTLISQIKYSTFCMSIVLSSEAASKSRLTKDESIPADMIIQSYLSHISSTLDEHSFYGLRHARHF